MTQPSVAIPEFTALPAPIYFRHDEFSAGARCETHAHAWGQLNYASQGVMELNIAGSPFFCLHRSMRSGFPLMPNTAALCNRLPAEPCTLVLSPILNDCAERDIKAPPTEADIRLAQVVLDQLEQSPSEKR